LIEKALDVRVAWKREHTVELVVSQNGGCLQGGPALAIGDQRVRARREQAPHFAKITAHHGTVEERVAERVLIVGITDCECHVLILPGKNDKSVAGLLSIVVFIPA
jgi:hypothetical protein